ncbi:hypothetical protein [Microcystis phage Mel-JY01]
MAFKLVIVTLSIIILSSSIIADNKLKIDKIKNNLTKKIIYNSIAWVESKNKVDAKSSDGSVGILQIKPVVITDVNRICKIKNLKNKYTLRDRLSEKKSAEIFWIYQEFYNSDINFNFLSKKDMEKIARKWNGGPKGHRKPQTKKYWKKVSERITYEIKGNNISDSVVKKMNWNLI